MFTAVIENIYSEQTRSSGQANQPRYTYSDGTMHAREGIWILNGTNMGPPIILDVSALNRGFSNLVMGFTFRHSKYTLLPQARDWVEIFRHEETIRHSTAIGYMYNGRKLARVMSIHEDSGGYPSKYLSMDVKSVSERSFILVNGLGRHFCHSIPWSYNFRACANSTPVGMGGERSLKGLQ